MFGLNIYAVIGAVIAFCVYTGVVYTKGRSDMRANWEAAEAKIQKAVDDKVKAAYEAKGTVERTLGADKDKLLICPRDIGHAASKPMAVTEPMIKSTSMACALLMAVFLLPLVGCSTATADRLVDLPRAKIPERPPAIQADPPVVNFQSRLRAIFSISPETATSPPASLVPVVPGSTP